MQNIVTGEPFKFEVKEGDRAYNQKHYEALGEVGNVGNAKSSQFSLGTLLAARYISGSQCKAKINTV